MCGCAPSPGLYLELRPELGRGVHRPLLQLQTLPAAAGAVSLKLSPNVSLLSHTSPSPLLPVRPRQGPQPGIEPHQVSLSVILTYALPVRTPHASPPFYQRCSRTPRCFLSLCLCSGCSSSENASSLSSPSLKIYFQGRLS